MRVARIHQRRRGCTRPTAACRFRLRPDRTIAVQVQAAPIDWFYDSPPLKKTATFFNERFMADRDGEGWYEKAIIIRFVVCQGLSNHGLGLAKGHGISGDTAGRWSLNQRFR